MWHLYIFMSVLAASVVLKLAHPLMGRGRHKHGDTPTPADGLLVYLLVGAVPLLSLFLYLMLGSPDLPGKPAVFSNLVTLYDRNYALLAQRPMERLVTENPRDLGALMTLGQIHLRLKKYPEAVRFYETAAAVSLETNDIRHRVATSVLGEAQVMANNGIVGDDALKTFNYAVTLNKTSPAAHYYLALALAQKGDKKAALEIWRRLLDEGRPDAYWTKKVRESVASTAAELRETGE